jgi:hypothetical protein
MEAKEVNVVMRLEGGTEKDVLTINEMEVFINENKMIDVARLLRCIRNPTF